MKWSKFYIFRIEFLGFRFHGWQFQHDQMTVQGMIDKTFRFLFKDLKFKTLGAGRTDAMVSAKDFAFELFTQHDIQVDDFLELFNENLPTDIRLKSITETDAQFNIIQSPKVSYLTKPTKSKSLKQLRDIALASTPHQADTKEQLTHVKYRSEAIKLYAISPNTYTESSLKNVKAGRICAIIGLSLSSLYFLFWIVYIAFFAAAIGGGLLHGLGGF